MKLLIFFIIAMLVVFVWLSNTEISFEPFSINFHKWKYALGYILIIFCLTIGCTLIYLDGVSEGKKQYKSMVEEVINEILQEGKNNTK